MVDVIEVDYVELVDYVMKYEFSEESCKSIKLIVVEFNGFGLDSVIYNNLCKMVFEHFGFEFYPFIRIDDAAAERMRMELEMVIEVLKVLYPSMVEDYTAKFLRAGGVY
jgi:hypothetical protein